MQKAASTADEPDSLSTQAEDIERAVRELDHNEAAVLGAAQDVSDLDGRGTMLMLAAASLYAICKTDQKPDGVEVMGFSFKFGDWQVMAAVIAAFTLYLLILFLFAAWAELRRWRLTQNHTWRASREKIAELVRLSSLAFDQHVARIMAVDDLRNRMFRYPAPVGPEAYAVPPVPSVAEVMAWFEEQVEIERSKLTSLGWFRLYPVDYWTRSIEIEREFVRKTAEMNVQGLPLEQEAVVRDGLFERRRAAYKELGRQSDHQRATPEQERYRDLLAHSNAAGKDLSRVTAAMRWRFRFVAAVPLATALFSLFTFVQVVALSR